MRTGLKKAIILIYGIIIGLVSGLILDRIITLKIIREKIAAIKKFTGYFDLTCHWLELKSQGRQLADYLIENNYQTIAIYGMGVLGKQFLKELAGSNIKVAYGIDKNIKESETGTFIFTPEARWEQESVVDAIVVTPTFAFHEIEPELRKRIRCPIISLADIIEYVRV